MKKEKRKRDALAAKIVTAGPVSCWMIFFVAIPIAYVFLMSFMNRGEYGGVTFGFTLENFMQAFSTLYLKVFARSLLIATAVTLICLLLAYPFAYFLCKKSAITRTVMMSMVMIPFMVSSLIRLFSWINLLRKDGIINTFLVNLGIISEPLQMVYNMCGVMIGLVYTLLPFMIMPLYSSIEKLDHSLLQAASDLGSKPVHTFFTVTLPQTAPGIFGGVMMTFIPTLGMFFVTDLMGGNKVQVVGNIIRDQFMTAHNWPLGAALAVLLILLTLILVALYKKSGGNMDELGV